MAARHLIRPAPIRRPLRTAERRGECGTFEPSVRARRGGRSGEIGGSHPLPPEGSTATGLVWVEGSGPRLVGWNPTGSHHVGEHPTPLRQHMKKRAMAVGCIVVGTGQYLVVGAWSTYAARRPFGRNQQTPRGIGYPRVRK